MDAYLGEIMLFAGAVTPDGWLECNGAAVQIAQNPALYSLLGTAYGGDGVNTFALPDLRDRIPVSMGQRPSGSNWPLGSVQGSRTVTLTPSQMPNHTHSMNLSANLATSPSIGSGVNVLAATAPDLLTYSDSTSPLGAAANLSPKMLQQVGGSQPHPNMMPTAYLRYLICSNGIYPDNP